MAMIKSANNISFDDVCKFVSVEYVKDKIGVERSVETVSEPILCEISSIYAAEFYKAAQAGIRPSFKITTWSENYSDQPIAEVDGKRYAIIRTYRHDDVVEITVEERIGGVSNEHKN